MKIIIEYDNMEDAQMALAAFRYLSALQDHSSYLRGLAKYSDLPDDQAELVDKVRDNLLECCDGFALWE